MKLGGTNGEAAEGVGVDEIGNIYITAATFTEDLPTPDCSCQRTNAGGGDAYFACFNPALSQVYYFRSAGNSLVNINIKNNTR